MAVRRFGIGARATVASVLALALTAIAFGVALLATAQSRSHSDELRQRLVPASIAADDLLSSLISQQNRLRDAVTAGRPSGLAYYEAAGALAARATVQVAHYARGDPPMTARLRAVASAHHAWLVNVADPQVAALQRGDIAAARALQADTALVSPYVFSVRTSGVALQQQIAGEEQAVTGALDRAHDTLLGALIAMIVVAAAATAAVIAGVWHGVLRPFGQLRRAVAVVADGRYTERIPTVGPPELADLSRDVELMRTRLVDAFAERERARAATDEERLQKRLRQSQALESLGRLVGGVAHDFNNLLGIISGYTEFTADRLEVLAAEDPRLQPLLEDIEQVQTAAQQAIRVTRQLLTFAKGKTASREVLDVNEVVGGSAELLRRTLGERIDLGIEAGDGLWPVDADRGQLEQVLVNLTVNARDAMPDGGRLTITTGNAEVGAEYASRQPGLQPGRYCLLTVADTGTGMDAATIEHVFEPFFSTKPPGRGTGLGLATVYGIVTGLGGTVGILSKPGLGTTMNVFLPVSEQARPAVPAPSPPAEETRGHGEAILLVEDEGGLRTIAARFLARNGYAVREVADGAGAVGLAGDPGERIDLLLTDMVMPSMLGHEVAERVRALRPGLPALFMTGYAQQVLDFHGIDPAQLDIVQKPFTEAVLLARVRRALDRARRAATA